MSELTEEHLAKMARQTFIKQKASHVTQSSSSAHVAPRAKLSAMDIPREPGTTEDKADERPWRQP